MKKKIIIVEDNKDVQEAFQLLIETKTSNYEVVNAYTTCEDALNKLETDLPDIVLMDIDLPGMNGIEGTRNIRQTLPRTDILIISVHENSQYVFDALCAGATGYITKNSNHTQLLRALDEVSAGGAPMSTQIAKLVVKSFRRESESPLTNRETDVLNLLAEGKSYMDIADQISVSKDTVKFHIKNIYLKLQVSNKIEAVTKAKSEGFI
ncbi:response regulator [Flammeovirga yaeyamensis]|uniref:Response regulator n=1 Tax=Flammeovirga yaeyamensis TaxID=367791 RepID=A0AAX1N627_9BACT|nr:response regulator transcription factor [Flammeovirga yaeyamensis]MBB3697450.1 DNA-binding NarL/FixJ family response regulator [Flammeovirga yaeyamensis]NMF36144.1 response regulator transcription factor [Flammeovirga yaeyamensis]QWG02877.1 response regulator [Flammeovirga yaeyamensis]